MFENMKTVRSTHFFVFDSRMFSSWFGSLRFLVSDVPFKDMVLLSDVYQSSSIVIRLYIMYNREGTINILYCWKQLYYICIAEPSAKSTTTKPRRVKGSKTMNRRNILSYGRTVTKKNKLIKNPEDGNFFFQNKRTPPPVDRIKKKPTILDKDVVPESLVKKWCGVFSIYIEHFGSRPNIIHVHQ